MATLCVTNGFLSGVADLVVRILQYRLMLSDGVWEHCSEGEAADERASLYLGSDHVGARDADVCE
jgi:hypothetical protein